MLLPKKISTAITIITMYFTFRKLAVCIVAFSGISCARPCGQGHKEGVGAGRSLKQAEDCKVEYGIDFANDKPMNNGNLPRNIVESPQECCDMCGRTPGCKSWVLILTDTRWNKKGACWLKDEVPERSNCLVCAGGVAPERSATIAPRIIDEKCLFLPGMDFQGGDFAVHHDIWSDEFCCDLCKLEGPNCKAWTRVNNGKCFLKHRISTPSICPRCQASGIIEERQSRADLLRLADFLKIIRGNLDKMDESSKPKDSNKLRSEIDGFLGRVEALGG